MPIKVIQDHQLQYQMKAQVVNSLNLHPILRHFPSVFVKLLLFPLGCLSYNTVIRGNPKLVTTTFDINKLQTSHYCMV